MARPTDLAKELENISKAIALSEKNSPIKFLPIDRINTIIAVAPNPGAFAEVEQWLAKLDVPIKVAAGGIKDYVYRVHYGDAISMACSIQALYGQLSGYGGYGGMAAGQNAILACMGTSNSGDGNGFGGGGFGGGGFGGGGGGGGFGGGGFGGGGLAEWLWRRCVRCRRIRRWRLWRRSVRRRLRERVDTATECGCAGRHSPAAYPTPNAAGARRRTGTGDLTGTYLGITPGAVLASAEVRASSRTR